ncbi:APC family permease [Nocardiopsis baichengensis]|uniref:APC family permease n=1 Tax=Nocardiopsis baichengensis TaxID=280240 RepID=UPI00034D79C5|nr:amino acid permease [Nocardiopsis baichengensis]
MSSTQDPPAEASRLRGHLRLPGAVALAITIVVGSGALVLPGIVYGQVGDAALYTWIAASAATVPLLVVFARLGAAHPGAGGVAGFAQAAFGRHAAAGVEVLSLGTFGLGIPAIALTGANYLTALPGLTQVPGPAAAALLLAGAAGVVAVGVSLSTRVQVVLALVLTTMLLVIGVLAVGAGEPAQHLPPPEPGAVVTGVLVIGAVFFAYTGWEMLSFTTEEYADPRRDFPRVVAISFVIVVVMYLLLALGVQTLLARDDSEALKAPVRALVAESVSPGAAGVVAVLGVVIIAANLIGAVWGASRLVMSSAREGLLPRALARLGGAAQPRRAVGACLAGFLAVLAANQTGLLSLSELLTIAGQNFYLLYLVCAVAYARLFRGAHRVFGIAVTAVLGGVAAFAFSPAQLAYCAALLLAGAGAAALRSRGAARTPRTGERS